MESSRKKIKLSRLITIAIAGCLVVFNSCYADNKSKLPVQSQYTVDNEELLLQSYPFFKNKGVKVDDILVRLKAIRNILATKPITESTKTLPYTFVHQFYVPLLYAYDTNNKELKDEFSNTVTIEIFNKVKSSEILSSLDKKIYYFFISEYLRKSGINGDKKKMELYNNIYNETIGYWHKRDAKVWKGEPYNYKGVKQRIHSILEGKSHGKFSYYDAVTDNELFVMATSSSLSLVEQEYKGEPTKEMLDISHMFLEVFHKLVVFEKSGIWQLQPNVWKDHPDYKDVILARGESVTWDAAHFARFPVYLSLLEEVFRNNEEEVGYIEKLRTGLVHSFITNVISYSSSKKMKFNNYMSGNNSKYRVGYKTRVEGLGPGENYIHIFYGWWKLLDDKKVEDVYTRLQQDFDTYCIENPLVASHDKFYRQVIRLN